MLTYVLISKAVAVASQFHCNGFGCQRLYSSTSTPAPTTHFLVKYLVDSLGFSKKQATSTCSKVVTSSSTTTLKHADLVLNFLKQTGLDNTQMKKLVSKAPTLLFSDVSNTLQPKFHYLMNNIGLSRSDLVNIIAKNAAIVETDLDDHLIPLIGCLRKTLGSYKNVVKAIKRTPLLLSYDGGHHIIKTNVLWLKNRGVPDARIKDTSSQDESTLERKIGIFKSFGWSDDDILYIFQKLPDCVGLSEVRIQEALNIFIKELVLNLLYLVSHPAILMYSLEKRVVPRVQVLEILDEKKVERRKWPLYIVLRLIESDFIEYFVLPYNDQIPDGVEVLDVMYGFQYICRRDCLLQYQHIPLNIRV
ncbi:hypothetical protein RND71_004218 [Anisodus tanguticus]|uniref:Uncharacterized protein n=1 Tax=Anisodus tanguticus TaxID=243964 RepID=A0AAE1SXG6_9SOLA|nr:hypothetical protein RND71_004218 [Anisodus tanguticus]